MTVAELFNKCEDNQKLVINIGGYRFRGNWYQDHMLDILNEYKYHKCDVTRDDENLLVATVRRW